LVRAPNKWRQTSTHDEIMVQRSSGAVVAIEPVRRWSLPIDAKHF
jgi:hypothetical protein